MGVRGRGRCECVRYRLIVRVNRWNGQRVGVFFVSNVLSDSFSLHV